MKRMIIQCQYAAKRYDPNGDDWGEAHELTADQVADLLTMLPDPTPKTTIDGWTYYMKPNGLLVRTKEVN